MTDRPHCLKPADCQARGAGRHCRSCNATYRNRTPEQIAASQTPAARANRTATYKATCKERGPLPGWCPSEYREYDRKLVQNQYTIKQRKQMVAALQKKDREKVRLEIERRTAEQRARHRAQKAQEY